MGEFYSKSALFVIILSTSLCAIFCENFSLDLDDGICNENVSQSKMLIKYQRVPYTITYLGRCWPDLNCIKSKLNTRLESYYQVRDQASEIRVCCEGFEKDEEGSKATEGNAAENIKLVCKPKCTALCINADCSHPNTCTCHTGYTKDRNTPNICVPTCDITCINGHCEEPNVCSCKSGYEIRDNPGICEPICDGPCLNGTCVLPDVCECLPGFVLDGYRSHMCNPVCELGCANGICVAPGICQCLPGYRFVTSSKRFCVKSSLIVDKPLEDVMINNSRNFTDMLRISVQTSKVKDIVEENRLNIPRAVNVSTNENSRKCKCAEKKSKIIDSYWLRFGECIFLLVGFALIIFFVFMKFDWRHALARLHFSKIGYLCFLNPLYHGGNQEKSVVKV